MDSCGPIFEGNLCMGGPRPIRDVVASVKVAIPVQCSFLVFSEYFVELVTVWLHFRLLSVCVYVCSSLTGCSVCLPESVCLCCQRLDKSRVKSWLFRCRLPQFLQTDLYAEYSLVQCLLRRSAEQKRRTEIKFSSNQNVFGGGGTKLVPYSFYYL